MTRWFFWHMLTIIVLANVIFDLVAAPVALQLTDKIDRMAGRSEQVAALEEGPIRAALVRPDRAWLVTGILRHAMYARYALTAVPLLFLAYMAARRRLTDDLVATAISIGALIMAAKALAWYLVEFLSTTALPY